MSLLQLEHYTIVIDHHRHIINYVNSILMYFDNYRLPFLKGFQSEGDSIEVFVDPKEIDKIQALAELVHISGADATKFQVTYL